MGRLSVEKHVWVMIGVITTAGIVALEGEMIIAGVLLSAYAVSMYLVVKERRKEVDV